MDSDEGVLLPIHEHHMVPWNDLRSGDCCGRFKSISDGLYCKSCDFFVHKECSESSESIEHPSHTNHTLWLSSRPENSYCDFCGKDIANHYYRCEWCEFDVDLHCANYPPLKVIDISEMHRHELTLVKERNQLDCCVKCGKTGGREFLYKCHECDSAFHVDCLPYPLEVNHSHHSLHPLKLVTGRPGEYSDGICRLCAKKIDEKVFYHCSSCNFSLDICCVSTPPPQSLLDLKAHDHQLFLLPRLDSFTCNACGLKGDRSPYICVQCGIMIHQDCIGLPRVININRHDHRISRTSLLGVVNSSVCGVCHQKVDWTYGGYSCQRCTSYVVHSKCATRKDVWNGKELEDVPDETKDTEPYVVIDDNTIQHFSHKEHHLRLNVNDLLCEDTKHCKACAHPIGLQSFYGCIMDCDFVIHQICAGFPTKKWHVLHNEQLTLVTRKTSRFECDACGRDSNGFRYKHKDRYKQKTTQLDVLCGSISEPFVHPSHPNHPLYYTSPDEKRQCNGCKKWISPFLMCIEDGCGFSLDFKCATLPQVVKHRVDDHPLLLCYGEEASGKCWCDICEKETNSKTWFYTCKDHHASLHTKCVLGLTGLLPGNTIQFYRESFEVVLNNSITRPFCKGCKSRCIYPIKLRMIGTSDTYICSLDCTDFMPMFYR